MQSIGLDEVKFREICKIPISQRYVNDMVISVENSDINLESDKKTVTISGELYYLECIVLITDQPLEKITLVRSDKQELNGIDVEFIGNCGCYLLRLAGIKEAELAITPHINRKLYILVKKYNFSYNEDEKQYIEYKHPNKRIWAWMTNPRAPFPLTIIKQNPCYIYGDPAKLVPYQYTLMHHPVGKRYFFKGDIQGRSVDAILIFPIAVINGTNNFVTYDYYRRHHRLMKVRSQWMKRTPFFPTNKVDPNLARMVSNQPIFTQEDIFCYSYVIDGTNFHYYDPDSTYLPLSLDAPMECPNIDPFVELNITEQCSCDPITHFATVIITRDIAHCKNIDTALNVNYCRYFDLDYYHRVYDSDYSVHNSDVDSDVDSDDEQENEQNDEDMT